MAEAARPDGAPTPLAGYWAVTEDGHVSQVRAGENLGATLHHDAVVRELLAVPVLDSPARFVPGSAPGSARRHVVFVVTEATTGRPLQALSLGCWARGLGRRSSRDARSPQWVRSRSVKIKRSLS